MQKNFLCVTYTTLTTLKNKRERERERERVKEERCLTFFVMLMRNSANIQTESHYKKGKIL